MFKHTEKNCKLANRGKLRNIYVLILLMTLQSNINHLLNLSTADDTLNIGLKGILNSPSNSSF